MGRGIARVAETTKKCSCDNPKIYNNHIRVNQKTKEISYYLDCHNCGAYWSTKSLKARDYWLDEFHKIPSTWEGYSYKGEKTVIELFKEIDESRLNYLMGVESVELKKLEEQKKVWEKAKAKTIKFKNEMNL